MQVAIREFSSEEVEALPYSNSGSGSDSSLPTLERYYTLFRDDNTATLVDVTDNRARKSFNADVFTRSNSELFAKLTVPMLDMVLETRRAPQAVIVVDGVAQCRRSVLLDSEDGLVARAVAHLQSSAKVQSIYLGAVLLDDDNRLVDLLARSNDSNADEPVILEDTHEQFTSVEDTTYVEVGGVSHLNGLLRGPLTSSFVTGKHIIYTIIIAFKDGKTMPNTTVQFISFAVDEVSRGMKSTRHCVATAASLIEARAPVLSFSATKLIFLLKPALLGQQPGAWVCCMSPVSRSDPATRETFKDAFSVAQTAARVYSTRVSVTALAVPRITSGHQTANASPLQQENHPERQQIPVEPVLTKQLGKGHSSHSPDRSAPLAADGLVTTPADARPNVPSDPNSPVTCTCGARYELETYKSAMESAMARLRADLTEYASRLRECQRKAKEEHENMAAERNELQETVRVLRARSYPVPLSAADAAVQTPPEAGRISVAASEELRIGRERCAELLEMVEYHQAEIGAHVTREAAYRERVRELESLLQRQVEKEHTLRQRASASEQQVPATSAGIGGGSSGEAERRSDEGGSREVHEYMKAIQSSLEKQQEAQKDEAARHARMLEELRSGYEEEMERLHKEVARVSERLGQQQTLKPERNVQTHTGHQEAPQLRARSSFIGSPGAAPPPPKNDTSPNGDCVIQPESSVMLNATPDVRYSSSLRRDRGTGSRFYTAHRRTQSFEDFMQQEPHYHLSRSSPLSFAYNRR